MCIPHSLSIRICVRALSNLQWLHRPSGPAASLFSHCEHFVCGFSPLVGLLSFWSFSRRMNLGNPAPFLISQDII